MDGGIDFSYFNSAPMPYAFYGMPPTPQSNTPLGDDFKRFPGNVRTHCVMIEANTDWVQEHFDPSSFGAFQQNFQYDHTLFAAHQPHAHHMANMSPPLQAASQRHSIISMSEQPIDMPDSAVSPIDPLGTQRSSSEEKDNTKPQQNKRKEQNRAA